MNLSNNVTLYAVFPFIQSEEHPQQPFFYKVKKFKKLYSGLNYTLQWVEKICSSHRAHFLSEQRKILKLYTSTFAIPYWLERAAAISSISETTQSSQENGTNKRYKIAIVSLDFLSASFNLVNCFKNTDLVDVVKYFPILPRTLSNIHCILKFILKLNNLMQSYLKIKVCKLEEELKVGMILDCIKSILGLYGTILSIFSLFFCMSVSAYWMLCISTFTFFSTLIFDLYKTISHIDSSIKLHNISGIFSNYPTV